VTWSLEGATSAATTLSADGLLTVGLDEAINSVLTVTATSVYDPTKSDSAAVTVVPGTVISLTKAKATPASIIAGGTFTLNVDVRAESEHTTAPTATREIVVTFAGTTQVVPLIDGAAVVMLPTTGLAVGYYVVEVKYLGDRVYAPSQDSKTLTVRAAPGGGPVAV